MAPNGTFKSPAFLQLTVDVLKLRTSTVIWEEFWEFTGVIGHNNEIRECIFTDLLTAKVLIGVDSLCQTGAQGASTL